MIYLRCLLALLGIISFLVSAVNGPNQASAARNPFISSEKEAAPPVKEPLMKYPAFLNPIMTKLALFQQAMKQKMVQYAKKIQSNPLGASSWWFMCISFFYGVVHALGPGHGKIYACSYFLSQPSTVRRVLLFGNLTMLMHVFSGTVLILFGALVLKTSGAMTLENSSVVLERVSYSLLAVVGLFIIGKTIYELKTGRGRQHEYPDRTDLKPLIATALAVGMVPCPGAALILLFSLTLGILTAGLWAMLFIAAGMAGTTSLFALGAIGFRKTFLSLTQGNEHLTNGIYLLFSLGGAACITLLGLLLFVGSL